jgi:P pilus assembly chaperone PapD
MSFKILAVLTLLGRPLSAQMQVDNAEIWLTSSQLEGSFTVSNGSAETLQFNLADGDWDRADDGQNRFFPAGTTPSSCERALQVFPRQLRLAPGGAQPVRISLNRDSLPSRACWSIVFVESEPPSLQSRSGVRYLTRIGVKIYYTPAQAVRLAEMVEFIQPPNATPSDTNAVEIGIRNTGTQALSIGGSIEIRRPDNFIVATVPIEPVPVLPAALRIMRVTLPKVLPGSYVALVTLSYGSDEDLVGQTPLVIR